MPTTRPRYQVTDTARLRELLDRAARAWPGQAGDRKALLFALAEAGAAQLPGPADPADVDLRGRAGEWVALAGGRLLVADADPAAIVAWLREHDARAEQVYRVPYAEEDAAGEHALT